MNYRILNTIGEKYTASAREILSSLGRTDFLVLKQSQLIEIIKDYDIIVVGLGLNIDREVIDRGEKLKIIATATTGLDHIDVEYAENKGVKILSLRGETEFLNTITGTAELAFGLLINLWRHIISAAGSVKNYEWDREKFRGHNLCGNTLGIVGLGRLGRWMARYGQAFGMNVIVFDPYADEEIFKDLVCEKVDFDTLLDRSDAISIHVHLNQETESMFNVEVLSKMKNSAILINTSRGKIVKEDDLLAALEDKIIAGYATDVLADELEFDKSFSDHPLVEYAKSHNNLIIVPHIGGMTFESREATDIFIAEKIKKYISSENNGKN